MDRTLAAFEMSKEILSKSADLQSPLTIPLQVRNAIQLAEEFLNQWDKWGASHKDKVEEMRKQVVFDFVHETFTKVGKIGAIKELRAKTGIGLKEAKDQVEAWEKEFNWQSPAPGQW
jgi:ribosomal protein L7/L12